MPSQAAPPAAPEASPEENEGISLMGQQDSPYDNKFVKNEQTFREARSLELDAHPRTRSQGRVMQVVDWKKEKQSLDLFLKTDKGLWFLAQVVAFILSIRLLLTGLGTKNDNAFNTFLHVMTQPLVGPFERFTQSIVLGSEGQAFETAAALALASVFIALVLVAKLVRSLAAK